MPVTHRQALAQAHEQRVCKTFGRELDGKQTDLTLRAMAKRAAKRITHELRAQAHAHHARARISADTDEPLLGRGVKVWAFGLSGGWRLRSAHHNELVDALGARRQHVPRIQARIRDLMTARPGPLLVRTRRLKRLVNHKVHAHAAHSQPLSSRFWPW